MSDYKPVKGDRVRVVLEGEVSEVWHSGRFVLQSDDDAVEIGFSADRVEGFNVSIEKIEPPVEVFQPGDVVRSILFPEHVYRLGNGGYYSHSMEKTYRPLGAFTADEYELVFRP